MSEQVVDGLGSAGVAVGQTIRMENGDASTAAGKPAPAVGKIVALTVEGVLLVAYSLLLPALWNVAPDVPLVLSLFGLKKALDAGAAAAATVAVRAILLVPLPAFLIVDFSERVQTAAASRGKELAAVPDGLLRFRDLACWAAPTLAVVALVAPTGVSVARSVATQLKLGEFAGTTIAVSCLAVAVCSGALGWYLVRRHRGSGENGEADAPAPAACALAAAAGAAFGPIAAAVLCITAALLVDGVILGVIMLVKLIINLIVAAVMFLFVLLAIPVMILAVILGVARQ